MARLWIFVLVVGSVLYSTCGQNQYHREVKPKRRLQAATRPQRQVVLGGYTVPLNEANAAAVVDDSTQNAQATQSAVQYLSQIYGQPQQQIQSLQQGQSQTQVHNFQIQSVIPQTLNRISFIDQYGQLVQVAQNSASNSAPQQTLRYVDQYGNDIHVGGQAQSAPLVIHQPQAILAANPVVHKTVQVAPQAVHFHQTVPQPHHLFQQLLTPQQHVFQELIQPQPVYHQHVQVQPPLYHQIAAPAPVVHQIAAPAPVVHQHLVQVPQPVYHQVAVPAPHVVQEAVVHGPPPQVQILAHPQPQIIAHPQPLPQLIAHPQPVVKFHAPAPVPIIKNLVVPKIAVPVVEKTIIPLQPAVVPVAVKVETPVTLIKQPVHPKPIFQKQIFALKNPPPRVLTYSDLCTVYPYQRKLTGCVLKKASLPEVHHPDIQLVSQDSSNQPLPLQSSKASAQIRMSRPTSVSSPTSTLANNNIRDLLNQNKNSKSSEEQILPLDQDDEEPSSLSNAENDETQDQGEQSNDNEENTNVAESSNKKEKLVKIRKPSKATTSTTTSTTTTTTTKKPKTKRRRSSKSKRRSQRKRSSTTTTTTSEKPFKLA